MSLYHPEPQETLFVTKRDIARLSSVQLRVQHHSSLGSYDMLAMFADGCLRAYGYNKLKRAAQTISSTYPEELGVHAELDLYRMLPEGKGGTVYVAGKLASSGSPMNNTRPCAYCSAILYEFGVSYVVYLQDGLPAKATTRSLNGIQD